MPPSHRLMPSVKPLVRCSVTEMPATPWISTTLPLHFSIGDEVGRRLPDAVVVATNPGPVGRRGGKLPVDVDDRDAGLHCFLRDRRERTAFMRQDDQDIGLLGDKRLDL